MIDQRERFERAFELFDMPEPAMARLVARRHRKEQNRRIGTAVVAFAVTAAAFGGLARAFLSGPGPRPADQPTGPFMGTWVSTDQDGSSQTMTIRALGEGAYEIVVHEDAATVCSDAPSTMTGTGRLEGARELVIPSPAFTCNDGSEPKVEDGPPLEEQLRNLTFVHDPETDKLTDSLGVVWDRAEKRDPTVVDFPNLTTTFVSPRNGFSIKHPDRVALTPADQLWGKRDGFDVVETGLGAVFKGVSTSTEHFAYLDGASFDERVDEYLSNYYVGGCGVPRSQQAEITIDGQPGRISECANRIEATVVADGRLYLFTLEHDRSDARAVFDAFVATIDLRPETAVDFPGLTTTFVSPTYGFSVRYFDRGKGTIRLATKHWNPSNQPHLTPRSPFDAVETGLRAYFQGASTQIPDGVSIDEWVDEYVTPLAAGGCGVPRSQQAEITIDGRPGRTAECPNRIEATVVAGGRLYLFTLLHGRTDARAFFDAWVATIDLTPETAAVP